MTFRVFNVQIDRSDTDDDYVTTMVKMDGQTIARVKSVGRPWNYTDIVTYLHNDHLGSAGSGTKADGSIAWREEYSPFGMTMINDTANDNQAGFTGHIKDSDTGLSYMQARYYDPVIGRFLSVDPVGFLDTGEPVHFNRYAYANNDPVNMFDPNGEKAWLVSRKTVGGQSHMFVAVQNAETKEIRRFSYGPSGGIIFSGKVVSLTDSGHPTDDTDRESFASFLEDPKAAKENGIEAEVINATDEAVIASGEAVDAVLGTRDKPAKGAPKYDGVPIGKQANSNSAAYAVANRANPNVTQAVPKEGNNSGKDQHKNIPTQRRPEE